MSKMPGSYLASRDQIAYLQTELAVISRAIELVKRAVPHRAIRSHRSDARRGAAHQGLLQRPGDSICGASAHPRCARSGTEQVRGVHTEPHGSSGLRRVHAEPTLGPSPPVGHGAVELAFATTMWVGRPAGRHLRPQLPAPARGRHSGGMTSR